MMSTLVQRFMTGQYTVTRMSKGSYGNNGEYMPGPVETIKVMGSLQPTNARELKLPEEGNRLRQYWKLYSDAPLLTDQTRTLASGDRVQINGDSYRVMSVEIWQNVDLPYYKSILYREPQNP